MTESGKSSPGKAWWELRHTELVGAAIAQIRRERRRDARGGLSREHTHTLTAAVETWVGEIILGESAASTRLCATVEHEWTLHTPQCQPQESAAVQILSATALATEVGMRELGVCRCLGEIETGLVRVEERAAAEASCGWGLMRLALESAADELGAGEEALLVWESNHPEHMRNGCAAAEAALAAGAHGEHHAHVGEQLQAAWSWMATKLGAQIFDDPTQRAARRRLAGAPAWLMRISAGMRPLSELSTKTAGIAPGELACALESALVREENHTWIEVSETLLRVSGAQGWAWPGRQLGTPLSGPERSVLTLALELAAERPMELSLIAATAACSSGSGTEPVTVRA